MPKAFLCVTDVQRGPTGNVTLSCHVVMDGATSDDSMPDYGTDYIVDSALSLSENMELLKSRIADIAVSRGYQMSTGDVIPFGAPIATNAASMTDKSKGITSDKDAAPKTKPAQAPTLVAQVTDSLTRAATWLIS